MCALPPRVMAVRNVPHVIAYFHPQINYQVVGYPLKPDL